MKELINHIKAQNAKTRAWVAEDPDNRLAFTTTEDPDHWASYGISTVREYELYNLYCEYWDSYKSVTGFRPRHLDHWYNYTMEDLQSMVEGIRKEVEAENRLYEAELAKEKAAKALVNRESFLPNPVLV